MDVATANGIAPDRLPKLAKRFKTKEEVYIAEVQRN
jgi:hypothetical protein